MIASAQSLPHRSTVVLLSLGRLGFEKLEFTHQSVALKSVHTRVYC